MVTTTAPVAAARFVPSYRGTVPAPQPKPPPCTNTMTGALSGCGLGVHTLRYRQSSPSGATLKGGKSCDCAHAFPGALARGELHAGAGAGGFQRSDPTGGAAN